MSYITPNAVTSPRRHLTLVAILDDGRTEDNPSGEDSVSVALCRWRNVGGAEEPILGIRWNGSDASPIGNPQSRGLPTWFVIPAHLRRSILERLTLSDASHALVWTPSTTSALMVRGGFVISAGSRSEARETA